MFSVYFMLHPLHNTSSKLFVNFNELTYSCEVHIIIFIIFISADFSRVYHELHRWFDHLLPAWIMDIGLRLTGQKPK